MTKIHPTAIVDPSAEIGDDVVIGPWCVIEPDVKIGPGCVLRENVIVRRYTTFGANNTMDAFGVYGGQPQDLKFDPDNVSYLKIGDGNRFLEHVTISRATGDGAATIVGDNTYWMAGAHAGHNAIISNEAILGNGCALGGHAVLGWRSILSGHVGVHQLTWIGEMVMTEGNSGFSMHVPPYVLGADINHVIGLNSIGLMRAPQLNDEDRRQIKEAFSLTYRSGLSSEKLLQQMDACTDWGEAAGKFRDFVRRVKTAEPPYNRGLCPLRSHGKGK